MQLHDRDLDLKLRELLAHKPVHDCAAPVDHLCQPRHVFLPAHVVDEEQRPAFMAEGGEDDLPALVDLTDDAVGGHAHVVEEDLVEVVVAGNLA
jgi:hypothetical protein